MLPVPRPVVAVGMDVGGTATRVLIVDTAGHPRGAGRAGGGNPTAHRPESWAPAMSAALNQALTQAGPAEVGSVVVGVAGGGELADSDTAASFERIIRAEAGSSCRIQLTGDAIVAFTAGTAQPDGTVLVAGTGAAAAAIRDHSVAGEADGHGWLLGDAGSGFWIGRETVRAVLAEIDGRGPVTGLRQLVVRALLGRDVPGGDARRTRLGLVQAAYARPPVDLSRLARLASQCAGEGDQVALGIARGATSHLVATVQAVRSPGETTPIVVTGGVATGDHMIASLLRQQLEAVWPACARPVRDGVAGAAWLALRAVPGISQGQAAALHPALLGQCRPRSRGPHC